MDQSGRRHLRRDTTRHTTLHSATFLLHKRHPPPPPLSWRPRVPPLPRPPSPCTPPSSDSARSSAPLPPAPPPFPSPPACLSGAGNAPHAPGVDDMGAQRRTPYCLLQLVRQGLPIVLVPLLGGGQDTCSEGCCRFVGQLMARGRRPVALARRSQNAP
eukprot:6913958-Pyramimonas_sp.AAC.1